MKYYRFIIVILCLSLVALLAACGDDQPATRAPAPVAKKPIAPKPQVVDVQPAAPVARYVFNPTGKRDPFESPLNIIVEVSPDTGVPLTPLQKFDLGQLRLIGVIIGKGEPRAMIISPDGKSFILKSGTKIGKNNGSVVDITTDAVFVKEKYLDFTGDVKTKIQEIRLPKQGGVK